MMEHKLGRITIQKILGQAWEKEKGNFGEEL